MLRSTSTYTAPATRSGGTGLTRNTANTVPSSIAPTKPSAVSSRVTSRPPSRKPRLSMTTCTPAPRPAAQDPATEPIAGGAGGSPLTTVPMVARHSFAQLPSA